MGLLTAVKELVSGQKQFEVLRSSSDAMFDKWEQDMRQIQEARVKIEPPKLLTKHDLQVDEALQINFENEFGYLPDERLDDLAESFIHFKIGEQHNVSFTVFVKAVISGRWKEYINNSPEPVSTILPQYKLNKVYRTQAVSKRREVTLPKLLPMAFVTLIVGIFLIFHII